MTYYKATFLDGHVKELKNSRRDYSHAWRITVTNERMEGADKTHTYTGFARTAELAAKAMQSESRYWVNGTAKSRNQWERKQNVPAGKVLFSQIVPVERRD